MHSNADNKTSHPEKEFSKNSYHGPSSSSTPGKVEVGKTNNNTQHPQPQTQSHVMSQVYQVTPQAFHTTSLPLTTKAIGQQFNQNQPLPIIPKITPERGLVPNVVYKAVPLEDLREHPNFQELPHPSEVHIQIVQHLSLYRKDSWQYTNLIKGRLNCSQLAGVLGFYEDKYARLLKIPEGRIGHKHALDAWEALREAPISDYQQLQRISRTPRFKRENKKWKITTRGVWMFDYEPNKGAALKQYRDLTCGRQHNANHPSIQWQRAHDPVGLLAAVNMFGKLGAKIKEVGMLPMEAVGIPPHFHVSRNQLKMPLLSASPQAIIEWYNGTIEVLSVVSMCPFQRVPPRGNSPQKKVEYRVIDRDPEKLIPPWMLPQIQFQIYCAGIKTTSAIVIFFSPTRGMNIFRVQKCPSYVDYMLTFVHMFQKQFAHTPPQENFFQEVFGYENFCRWTVELATKIPMLSHIRPDMVQTSPLDHPSNTNWFLENVPNPYFNTNNRNQGRSDNNMRLSRRRQNINPRFHRRKRRNNHNNNNHHPTPQLPSNFISNNYPPINNYEPFVNSYQNNQQQRGRRSRKKQMLQHNNLRNQQNNTSNQQTQQKPGLNSPPKFWNGSKQAVAQETSQDKQRQPDHPISTIRSQPKTEPSSKENGNQYTEPGAAWTGVKKEMQVLNAEGGEEPEGELLHEKSISPKDVTDVKGQHVSDAPTTE